MEIALNATPPIWVWALVALACGGALYEAVRSYTGASALPRRLRPLGLALRVLALLSLLAMVFEASLRLGGSEVAGRRIVVLFDSSKSMALADGTGKDESTRMARAQAVWERSETTVANWREDGGVVDVQRFDREAAAGAPDFEAAPIGSESNLARAFEDLNDPASEPPAAVVVVSDGLVAPSPSQRNHLLDLAEAVGAPVTTVAVGAPEITDLAVGDVRAGEFAFVENVTTFEATIARHGLPPTHQAKVSLLRDGESVANTVVTLAGDKTPVRFEVAPDRIGQFVYRIEVEAAEGEATEDNNGRSFVVKVLRDKVRVLHVAGRPDWDVRALRTLLKRDPNVELLSYYILRDWDDIDRADQTAPMSLIAFPTDELFRSELGSFDLLILHNFDALNHGNYLANIKKYVLDGGSLVVIGGDMGLAEGHYGQLAGLLPVESRARTAMEKGPYRPELTPAGARHPITAWMAQAREQGRLEDLPELDSFNETTLAGGKIATTALLTHPTRGGGTAPVLAVAEPGKGRTMVLATGATWRLGFAPDVPLLDGARPYDLLWLGAIRWLLHDEGAQRLVLETDRPRYEPGDEVGISVTALSTSYNPQEGVSVDYEIKPLGGGDSGAVATQGNLVTDALGRAQASLGALSTGAYEAIATREDEPDRPARRVFLVESATQELEAVDAVPGTELLAELARATEGDSLDADDGLPRDLPLAEPKGDRGAVVGREFPVWSSVWNVLLLLGCLCGEWFLRRKHSLA